MSHPPFQGSAEPATIDRMFSALRTETRRSVLAYFETSARQTASLDDLTEYVATHRTATDDRPREAIRRRLHHMALPKLDDVGFIDYDPRTTTVRYRDQGPATAWSNLAAEVQE